MDPDFEQQWRLVRVVRLVVFVLLPVAAVLIPMRGRFVRSPFRRLVVAGVVFWPCFAVFESGYSWQIAIDSALSRGRPTPDGPNTVGLMILYGWVLPLFIGLLAILIRFITLRLIALIKPAPRHELPPRT